MAVEEEGAGEPRRKEDRDESWRADQKAAEVEDGNHTTAQERQADRARLMLIEHVQDSAVDEER